MSILKDAESFLPGRAKELSEPQPNQSIIQPDTFLTGAACFLPRRAKEL